MNTEFLPYAKHQYNSLSFHNNPKKQAQRSIFIFKVAYLVSGGGRIQTQAVWFQCPCCRSHTILPLEITVLGDELNVGT